MHQFISEFVHRYVLQAIGEYCYTSLIENYNFNDLRCIKLAFSKLIGLGIVGLGSVVKLPQLIKVLNSKSSKGISFASYLIETFCYTVVICYNLRNGFSFSTWGETFFITLQNITIIIVVLLYKSSNDNTNTKQSINNRHNISNFFTILLSSFAFVVEYSLLMNTKFTSLNTLMYLQSFIIPLMILSKVPQIYTIYKNQSTGQLSAITVFCYFLGALARVFTTSQEVDDKIILMGFLMSFILNGILALQLIYYWNSTNQKARHKFSQ